MKFYPGEIYHVYNRGNIRQNVFFEERNYPFFLRKMESYLLPYCDILAWCLMPNHFHWLIKVKDQQFIESKLHEKDGSVMSLNKNIGILLRSYTNAINKAYKTKGSLFQQKTKAKNVNTGLTFRENYALICFLYIHQNPLKAKLSSVFKDWNYSSYLEYTSSNRHRHLCNKHLARNLLDLPSTPNDFEAFSYQTLPDGYQDDIF